VNKVVRAVARGLVVAMVLLGLASVPGGHAQAATAPQEGEHDVVVNPDPVDTTPAVLDGNTQAVIDLGSRVIVGGNFTQVKRYSDPTVYSRVGIFAYDKATGNIDQTFAPQLDGQVSAMVKAADGNIYVAGQFKSVNGVAGGYLVKLDPVTGQKITAFNASPAGMVYDLELQGNTLYAAGTFTKMRNIVRTNFAALDATTGKATALDIPFTTPATGTLRVMRIDASPDGRSLVAIGNFTQVGGLYRPNIVRLDLTTDPVTVSPWFTDMYRYGQCSSSYDTYIRDVDWSPDGSYFVTVATGAYGAPPKLCDAAARWESTVPAGTATPTWVDYTGGDSLTAVGITGAAVYVGGHERWANNATAADKKGIGAVDRKGITALDPVSGTALSWNPGRDRGLAVWRITPTAQGLYILNDSLNFDDEYHPRLTYLVTTGGSAPVRATNFGLPTTLTYTGSVSGGSVPAGQLEQVSYDGTTFGAQTASTDTSSWSGVTGVMSANNGVSYRLTTNQRFQVSTDGVTWSSLASWTDGRLSTITASTYANGFLYYTVLNDARLYTASFGLDQGLVSTTPTQVVSGSGDGLNWSTVRGLALVDGHLLATSTDGRLMRYDLGGRAPVPASALQLSGPGVDALNWSGVRGLHPAAPAVAPPPPAPLVEEHFDLGLDGWTGMVGFTLDSTTGAPAGTAPSAKVDVTGTRASGLHAFRSSTASEVCASMSVQLNRLTTSTVLSRLRTAANGAVGRMFVNAQRQLYIRSDVAGTQMNTGFTLPLGTWTDLKLCTKTATDGYLQLTVNGVAGPVWTGNMGTTNPGAIEIGDAAANSWSANFDDIVVKDPNAV
jgi:hypothetical protein